MTVLWFGIKLIQEPPSPSVTTHLDAEVVTPNAPVADSLEDLNPSIIGGNSAVPVHRPVGLSYNPNFCLITVVVVGFNSL